MTNLVERFARDESGATAIEYGLIERGHSKPDHMSSSTSRPPRPKHCPICGIAMLASRTAPTSRDMDRFECLSCDLVINYDGSNNPAATSRSE